MRLTPVFDLSAVRIHDHRIVARPPPPSRFERIRSKQATSAFERFAWPDAKPRLALERFAWPDAKPPLAGDPGLELMALSELGWADEALALVDAEPAPEVLAMLEYHFARGKLLESPELARVSSGLEPDRSRMEAARLAYERALELAPTAVEVTMRLARLCIYLGRADEALTRVDEVIALCPDEAEPRRLRGLVHLARQDLRGAARDYEAALARAPDAQVAWELAELYVRLGDTEAAARWRAEAGRLDASGQ